MTDKEYKDKYPIGTKIMYCPPCSHSMSGVREDIGKIGRIVGISEYDNPIIFLPKSKHISYKSTKQVPASWLSRWCYLKILPQKNQQLLFPFMD